MASVFTFSSFCIGLAPIPFTARVCHPAAVILGLLAFLAGFIAIRQLRASGEQGQAMALPGMRISIMTILAVLCFSFPGIALVYYGVDFLKASWPRINP